MLHEQLIEARSAVCFREGTFQKEARARAACCVGAPRAAKHRHFPENFLPSRGLTVCLGAPFLHVAAMSPCFHAASCHLQKFGLNQGPDFASDRCTYPPCLCSPQTDIICVPRICVLTPYPVSLFWVAAPSCIKLSNFIMLLSNHVLSPLHLSTFYVFLCLLLLFFFMHLHTSDSLKKEKTEKLLSGEEQRTDFLQL